MEPDQNNQSVHDEEDYDYPSQNEDQKSRQTRANRFKSLAAGIESSTKAVMDLMAGKKERFGAHTYLILTEEQDMQLHDALSEINKLIAEAQTMFDSYIELDKSTPKFENYLNLFYNLYEENIIKHSQTMFFMVHARDENLYMYPYYGLHTGHFGINKLSILLSRVRGTLIKCADYIMDEPPAPPPRVDTGYGGYLSRSYYPGSYPYGVGARDWREGWERERREERREPRDIGDVNEQQRV